MNDNYDLDELERRYYTQREWVTVVSPNGVTNEVCDGDVLAALLIAGWHIVTDELETEDYSV